MKQHMRKVVQVGLAVCLAVGLMPAPAFADERVAAGSSPQLATKAAGSMLADTDNAWKHDYALWSSPQTSYLHVNAAGKLERVEYSATGGLFVEELASDCMSAVSHKVIDRSAYSPSTMPPAGKPLWGGFYSGTNANYVVTGLENPSGVDIVATFRVTKFDKNWNYVSNAELFGANTTKPFANGSCSFTEVDGQLYIRTSHEMYDSGDGINHQANMTIVVQESTMTVSKTYELRSSINNYAGYVSHSFNQQIVANGNTIYGVDHGDSYPRSVVVKKFGDSYTNAFEIKGAEGRNATGASLGGASVSATTGNLLVVGNGVNQDSFVSNNYNESTLSRNVWLTVVNSSLGTSQKSLTMYSNGSAYSASTPFIVKINDSRFLVMWDVKTNGSHDSRLAYQFVDGNGNTIGGMYSANAALSDCQPILYNNKVVWYAGASGTPAVYSIDASNGTFDMAANLESATINCAAIQNRVYNANTNQYVNNAASYYNIANNPSVAVVLGGQTLKANTDYDLAFNFNRDTLTGAITANGKGKYAGQSTHLDFNIVPQSAQTFEVVVPPALQYTGELNKAHFTVKNALGETLTEGVDYDIEYMTDAIQAIVHSVHIIGKGFYYDTIVQHYTINETSIATATVTLSQTSYTFDKQKFEPEVTVVFNGKTLTAVDDYLVGYDNNYSAGTATVTVTGIKGYIGQVTKEFYIAKRDLSSANVEFNTNYNKGTVNKVILDGKTLVKDQDYRLTYESTSGTYPRAIVTGINNYTGQITTTYGEGKQSIESALVTLDKYEYQYNGQFVYVNPTVVLNGKTLVKGTDYKVDYKDNNRFPGKCTAIIQGINTYEGSVEADFTIYLDVTASNSEVTLMNTSYNYTGSAIKPEPTVKVNGWVVNKDINYTLSYKNNINAGTGTITVKYTNGYRGETNINFTINRKHIGWASIKFDQASYNYTGSAIIPKVTLTCGDTTLTQNKDYNIYCTNNVNAGSALLTITGIGNYTGTLQSSYSIVKTSTHAPAKKANTLTVQIKKNPFTVKYSKTKSAKYSFKKSTVFKISKAQGSVSFTKKSGSGKLSISKAGVVTVKKGTKKGAHKMKVVVRAAGDKRYEPDSQTVVVRVKVV